MKNLENQGMFLIYFPNPSSSSIIEVKLQTNLRLIHLADGSVGLINVGDRRNQRDRRNQNV